LSGFDGDGICSGAYGTWAGSSGCPYGPTGYEGPGTSFVTSPSLPDSAEIDFAGGLAPGKSAYFSLEGALTSAELTAREGTLQQMNCPGQGQPTQVTLPAVNAPVKLPDKPFTISYGALPLTFTGSAASSGSLCTVVSDRGALPVDIKIPIPFSSITVQVGASVTTATVDFFPANASNTAVPSCDFSLLRALRDTVTAPVIAGFAAADNCLLTSSSHTAGNVIARWSIPGFTEYTPDQNGVPIYTTPPLTYYADLSAMPGAPAQPASFHDILQSLETYIHTTLIQNLPMVDRVGMIQDPPAHLSVTDPLGRTFGLGPDHKTSAFPGSGYTEAGGRSIAWILEPVPGRYRVTASGQPISRFSTDFTVMQFLGHGTDPLTQNTAWHGILGLTGTASRTFVVGGTSIQPVLTAHESHTRCKRSQAVTFTLAGSVIPYGPATISWSFGDGTHATGMTVSHQYTTPGTYTPTVAVTNALGATATQALPPIVVGP
jgi:PKD domain